MRRAAIEPGLGLALAGDFLRAPDVPTLAAAVLRAVERLTGRPRLGFYLHGRDANGRGAPGEPSRAASANVSELFLARYEREGVAADPVVAAALTRRRVTSNLDVGRWRATDHYRRVSSPHRFAAVVIAPLVVGGRVAATLHVGDAEGAPPVDPAEVALVGTIAAAATLALEERERDEARRDEALRAFAALEGELGGGARALGAAGRGRPPAGELDAADAARSLVDRHGETARPPALARSWPAARGAAATPSEPADALAPLTPRQREAWPAARGAAATPSEPADALAPLTPRQREAWPAARGAAATPSEPADALAPLTPREREVAVLVAEDLSDAEIASRLHLSHHTVGQHLKSAYRKLGLRSRVGLARVVLSGAAPPAAWSAPPLARP